MVPQVFTGLTWPIFTFYWRYLSYSWGRDTIVIHPLIKGTSWGHYGNIRGIQWWKRMYILINNINGWLNQPHEVFYISSSLGFILLSCGWKQDTLRHIWNHQPVKHGKTHVKETIVGLLFSLYLSQAVVAHSSRFAHANHMLHARSKETCVLHIAWLLCASMFGINTFLSSRFDLQIQVTPKSTGWSSFLRVTKNSFGAYRKILPYFQARPSWRLNHGPQRFGAACDCVGKQGSCLIISPWRHCAPLGFAEG